jgi:hypothetical protein
MSLMSWQPWREWALPPSPPERIPAGNFNARTSLQSRSFLTD